MPPPAGLHSAGQRPGTLHRAPGPPQKTTNPRFSQLFRLLLDDGQLRNCRSGEPFEPEDVAARDGRSAWRFSTMVPGKGLQRAGADPDCVRTPYSLSSVTKSPSSRGRVKHSAVCQPRAHDIGNILQDTHATVQKESLIVGSVEGDGDGSDAEVRVEADRGDEGMWFQVLI